MIRETITMFAVAAFTIIILLSTPAVTAAQNNNFAACGSLPASDYERVFIQNVIAQLAIERSGDITSIPLKAHLFRQSNQTGGISMTELNRSLTYLNYHFLPAGIQFFWKDIPTYIDNSDMYQFDQRNLDTNGADNDDQLAAMEHEATDAINIYFVGSITLNNGANADGYARLPYDHIRSNRIVIRGGALLGNPAGVLVHEMGHYFGLLHTHEGTENGVNDDDAEHVSRNGANANCNSAGDLVCDTNADPGFSYTTFTAMTCNYHGTTKDAFNQLYTPPVDNIMSYYPLSCKHGFTEGQYQRIQQGLEYRLHGVTTYQLNTQAQTVAMPSNVNAIYEGANSRMLITWVDNANNETGYIIERSIVSATEGFEPIVDGSVNANKTSFADASIEANVIYHYRVRPSNGNTILNSAAATVSMGIQYCTPFNSSLAENKHNINKLEIKENGIPVMTHYSTGSQTTYSDFTAETISLKAGKSYSFQLEMSLLATGGFAAQNAAIYADFNNDGDFSDEGERLFRNSGTPSSRLIIGNITIPAKTLAGEVRLRIRTCKAPSIVLDACTSFTDGETEDYTLVVAPAQSAEVVTFEGEQNENNIELTWDLVNDVVASSVVLERSGDGIYYEPLATYDMDAVASSNAANRFNYTDENPLLGVNFYRLIKVEDTPQTNNEAVIAEVQSVFQQSTLHIFPNPASYDINISYKSAAASPATIELLDLNGHLLDMRINDSTTGTNTINLIIDGLADGLYYIRLSNGYTVTVKPFVKVRAN